MCILGTKVETSKIKPTLFEDIVMKVPANKTLEYCAAGHC